MTLISTRPILDATVGARYVVAFSAGVSSSPSGSESDPEDSSSWRSRRLFISCRISFLTVAQLTTPLFLKVSACMVEIKLCPSYFSSSGVKALNAPLLL